MGQTEKLGNAFIEKQVDGVAPVLSPGLHVVHDLGGITPPAVPFLLVATSSS